MTAQVPNYDGDKSLKYIKYDTEMKINEQFFVNMAFSFRGCYFIIIEIDPIKIFEYMNCTSKIIKFAMNMNLSFKTFEKIFLFGF